MAGAKAVNYLMKILFFKNIFIFLILVVSGVTLKGQDYPVNRVLPFQQDASANTDDKLAMQYYQAREFEKAAQIYEKLYEKSPNQSYYTLYFYCLLEIREWKKAEKLVRSQAKTETGDLRPLVDLGYLYYRMGDAEKSRKHYDEALKKLTANQQQILDLAIAFITRDENQYAIETYKKGRTLMKGEYPFSFELASVFERTGDFRGMLEEYIRLLEINRSYLQTVQDRLQFTLAYDPNNSKNELFRKYILEKVQKEPDQPWYSELLWWYSVQQKDFGMAMIQARALDRRLKEDGRRVYQLAQLSLSNDDYETAIDAYEYLISKGSSFPYYNKSRIELLNTKFKKIRFEPVQSQEALIALEKEFASEAEKNRGRADFIELYLNYAHLQAFYLDKTNEAVELLNGILENSSIDPKSRAEIKMELADIMLFSGDVWEATLLYQQVYQDFKNDLMGEQAKFRNARLSYFIGEFGWAKTQLDILKAATSRLIANDAMALSLLISENMDDDSLMVGLDYYSHADLLDYRNQYENAVITLDSIFTVFKFHPIFDDALLKKANIRIKQGKFAEADTLFGRLISEFPDDVTADQALFIRAKMNEDQLKNKEKAMQFYSDLMNRYPGSVYVVDSRKRYRTLRGDNIQ